MLQLLALTRPPVVKQIYTITISFIAIAVLLIMWTFHVSTHVIPLRVYTRSGLVWYVGRMEPKYSFTLTLGHLWYQAYGFFKLGNHQMFTACAQSRAKRYTRRLLTKTTAVVSFFVLRVWAGVPRTLSGAIAIHPGRGLRRNVPSEAQGIIPPI